MQIPRFSPAVLSHFFHLAAALLVRARMRDGLSALLFLAAIFGAPHADAATWARNYGTAAASSYVNATAVDVSGNVYIAGHFDGATLALGGVTLSRIGINDAFVAKLDAGGAVVWAKNYGGAGAWTTGTAIAADSSGNVYLGGGFNTANLSTPALTKIGSGDAYALKLDASGNTLWAKNYGGAGAWAVGNAIAADSSGNVYLGGIFYGANLSTPALTLIGGDDALILTNSTVTTYTGPTATGTGTATASVSGGAGCAFTTRQFVLPGSTPAGVTFPHGLLDFTLSGCTAGSTATLTVTYPSAVPAGTQYWKYGPTSSNATPHWYTIPATISGNTISFSITDGGLGDDDLTVNGTIVDQGGPGVLAASAIPTLSEWGLILLAGMLGMFGVGVMRHPMKRN